MHQKLTGQFRINQTNMKVICFKSGYMQGCSYPFKKTINIKITIFRHKDNMEKLIFKKKESSISTTTTHAIRMRVARSSSKRSQKVSSDSFFSFTILFFLIFWFISRILQVFFHPVHTVFKIFHAFSESLHQFRNLLPQIIKV